MTITEDDLQHPTHVIRFSVYDQDISSKNDYIGRCDVLLSQFLIDESESSLELKLIPVAHKGETPGQGCAGYLNIKFECSPASTVRSRAVRDLFSRFDRDGNGQLDANEFLQLQNCLSSAQRSKSEFNRADQNNDGLVDMTEFLNCIEQLIPDEVVADYYVKDAATPLRLHATGQQGAAVTEEQVRGFASRIRTRPPICALTPPTGWPRLVGVDDRMGFPRQVRSMLHHTRAVFFFARTEFHFLNIWYFLNI